MQRAGCIAAETGAPLYIVHTSSAKALDAALRWRQAGAQVFVETCPHYLTHDVAWPGGDLGKINPPLRSAADREALWQGLLSGAIDTVATDHVHRGVAAKAGGIWAASPGCPGLETLLPVLLGEGHHKRGLSLARIAELVSTNPARRMGLGARKGAILPGLDADLAFIDPDAEWTLSAATWSRAPAIPSTRAGRFGPRHARLSCAAEPCCATASSSMTPSVIGGSSRASSRRRATVAPDDRRRGPVRARTFDAGGRTYAISASLPRARGLRSRRAPPFRSKFCLENLLRHHELGHAVSMDDVARSAIGPRRGAAAEIAFHPAASSCRTLGHSAAGRPRRDARRHGGAGWRSARINPLSQVDLIIDHSVDRRRSRPPRCAARNLELEYRAKPGALRVPALGAAAFDNLRIVPPGTASSTRSIWNTWRAASGRDGDEPRAFPTPCWAWTATRRWSTGSASSDGASAASRPAPRCSASRRPCAAGGDRLRLVGALQAGVTATDLVLTVTRAPAKHGVVQNSSSFSVRGSRACACRPRHDRQHGAGVWRDDRLLPDRRETHRAICGRPAGRRERSTSSRPMPVRKGCGAINDAEPVFTDWSRSTSRRSSPASPARAAAGPLGAHAGEAIAGGCAFGHDRRRRALAVAGDVLRRSATATS